MPSLHIHNYLVSLQKIQIQISQSKDTNTKQFSVFEDHLNTYDEIQTVFEHPDLNSEDLMTQKTSAAFLTGEKTSGEKFERDNWISA